MTCEQGTFTLSDIWFGPFFGTCIICVKTIFFKNPAWFSRLFHFEYPSVLPLCCFFQVQFNRKVFPEKVEIYETYNSGAVKRLQFKRPNNKWYTVWQVATVQYIKKLRVFSPNFEVSFCGIWPSPSAKTISTLIIQIVSFTFSTSVALKKLMNTIYVLGDLQRLYHRYRYVRQFCVSCPIL